MLATLVVESPSWILKYVIIHFATHIYLFVSLMAITRLKVESPAVSHPWSRLGTLMVGPLCPLEVHPPRTACQVFCSHHSVRRNWQTDSSNLILIELCGSNSVLWVYCVRIQASSCVRTASHASTGTVQPVPGRLDLWQSAKLQSTQHFSGSIVKGKRPVHYHINNLSSVHVTTTRSGQKVCRRNLFPDLRSGLHLG